MSSFTNSMMNPNMIRNRPRTSMREPSFLNFPAIHATCVSKPPPRLRSTRNMPPARLISWPISNPGTRTYGQMQHLITLGGRESPEAAVSTFLRERVKQRKLGAFGFSPGAVFSSWFSADGKKLMWQIWFCFYVVYRNRECRVTFQSHPAQ